MFKKIEEPTIRNFTDAKFKTSRISMHFIMPLNAKTASAFALIPSVLTQSTSSHPNITDLSKHLSSLYGANFSCSVSKIGDNQVLSFLASGISNKYALGGQNLTKEYLSLIEECIFKPLTDKDGYFTKEAFTQERRQLLEHMDADFNDKKVYAKLRTSEIMFEGQPSAVRKYGDKETLMKVKREELIPLWNEIVDTAKVEIFVLGDCDYDIISNSFKDMFKNRKGNAKLFENPVYDVTNIKTVEEKMELSQSKLVLGFKTGEKPTIATRLMSVILGGTASSKLFLNVREKLSLCYYCSSSLNTENAAIFVESGVETENIEKTKDAILNEIEDLKNGIFTDDDLHFAKLAMINSYKSIKDSLYSTETWYLSQVLRDEILTPKEMEEKLLKVTKEDIINSAKKMNLDTVYMLKGEM
ncbi:MAG: pitrilysin family protein [Clostridia bacterium]